MTHEMIEDMQDGKMNFEEARMDTFGTEWPHCFISPKILAKTGFFYMNQYDLVKCQFCRVSISNWERGDNEVSEHLRWSPFCPLLRQKSTSNVPLEPKSEFEKLLPTLGEDVCGFRNNQKSRIGRSQLAYTETPHSFFTSRKPTRYMQFPDFSDKSKRMHTFNNWPRNKVQTPEQLSLAGFFHTQKEDRVICFSCGVILWNWMENETVWEQHALKSDKCEFMVQVKGSNYIKKTKQKFNEEM